MRRHHSWHIAAVVLTILAMFLANAAIAQSPAPASDVIPLLYLPLVMDGRAPIPVAPEAPAPPQTAPELPAPAPEPPAPTPAPAPLTKVTGPVAAPPAVTDNPDARQWDSDSVLWNGSGVVEPAFADSLHWNAAGDFTISGKLGVGWQPPAYLGDFRQSVNGLAVVRVTNPNAGAGAVAGFAAGTTMGTTPIYVFGPNYSGTWNGMFAKNYSMLRSDSGLNGLIVSTGGADPLIFGTNNAEHARITAEGNIGIGVQYVSSKLEVNNASDIHALRIWGPGAAGSQARLNFGDSEYVYIDEPTDDSLAIHSYYEVNLETPNVEVNGIKPVRIVRLTDINGYIDTGISAATYDCVVAGFAAYYDLQEDDAGLSAIWTHVYNGTWWVDAVLRDHNDYAYPDVDILCFVKAMVDYGGDRTLWDAD